MISSTLDKKAMLFTAKDPDALVKEIQERFGNNVGQILERVDVKDLSVEDQQQVVSQLKDAGLNGNAESLLSAYKVHRQELDRKAELNRRWYTPLVEGAQKVGGVVKDVLLAPVRAVGWAFKNHPVLSTIAVTALLAFLAYHFGIPLAQFSAMGGDERTEGVANTFRRLTESAPAVITPGTRELPLPNPTYPGFTDPGVVLPSQ